MTSLDMNGMSITVLRLGDRRDEVLSYIDLQVDSPNWTGCVNMEQYENNIVELNIQDGAADATDYSEGENYMSKRVRMGLSNIFDNVIKMEAEFTKQDSDVGDGDMGVGATRASKAV